MNDAEFLRRLAAELRSIGKADVADRLTALADRLDAEPTLEEVLAELAGQEFFHDGLAGDLHDVPDKAHAYRLGWDECIQATRECLRRVKE